jgi:hypothetical protein
VGQDVIAVPPRLCFVLAGALVACATGEDTQGSGPGLGDDSSPTTTAGSETSGVGSVTSDGSADATGVAATTGDTDDETTGCAEQPFFYDGDGDGHGDPLGEVVACSAPADHVPIGDDCDDGDPSNAPSLSEMCDGADNDCDGLVDEASPVHGLNDMRTEGTFVWTDGTAPSITPWGAGEPNDGAGAEDCVEFSPTTGIWNDVGCDEGRAFVCEAPSHETESRRTEISTARRDGRFAINPRDVVFGVGLRASAGRSSLRR